MTCRRYGLFRLPAIGAFAIALLPGVADAQTVPSTVQSIAEVVNAGDIVHVVRLQGGVEKGRIFSVSPTGLELLQERRKLMLAIDDIRAIRVEYRDGLADGAWMGVAAGAAIGMFLGSLTCDESGGILDFCGFSVVLGGGIGAGTGLIVGLIADGQSSATREVWRAPARTRKPGLDGHSRPGVTGIRVVVRW